MSAVGRTALVAVVAAIALAAGYSASQFLFGSDRRDPAPVIDLDNLPPTDAPTPSTAPAADGSVVPPPTLPPIPPTPTATLATVGPAPAPPAPAPPITPPGDDAESESDAESERESESENESESDEEDRDDGGLDD